MKTSDLPEIEPKIVYDGVHEPSDTYLTIIEDPWFPLHPIHLWDMLDDINIITDRIVVYIHVTYHA